MGINYGKLDDDDPLKAAIDSALAAEDRDAGGGATQPEHDEQFALVETARRKASMVDFDQPRIVRITRYGKRIYDDDNFIGGCKELRDAIATALGGRGDSQKDGFEWEYRQKKGEPKTIIEVFKRNDDENQTLRSSYGGGDGKRSREDQ